MKIRAQKQVIESILINLQPFLEKKDATQITSHVYLETMDGKCRVRGTDMEIGLEIVTDQFAIDHPGKFTANGRKLLDIVRILKDDEITLELLDNALLIKQKHSKFKLPVFDPESYPQFPSVDEKPKIELDSMSLIKNLRKITPAIDSNNPKHELNGALINVKSDKTDLVGTDTRRLAIATIDDGSETELSLIIPKKAILEIQKLFLDRIEMFYDETTLIIRSEDYFFFTRLINGRFPDYERIIPRSLKFEIELPKKEMLEAIRMITTISHDIKITFLSDTILFNSLSEDNIEAKTEIERETGIPDRFELSLNSKYLLDFLAQVEGDIFVMGLNEPTLPFVVKEGNFMTIIMPIIH
ncbi:DNA polymerase III subunit beta [Nitratifractor sp.]